MWRKVSLRARLIGLFGSLLLLGLIVDVGSMLLNATDRIEAEVESSMRLSVNVITTSLAGMHAQPDTNPALDRLVASLRNLRHVRVFRQGSSPLGAALLLAMRQQEGGEVPEWFANLVHPRMVIRRIRADIDDRHYGDLIVTSYPWDEMGEIWDDVEAVTLVGATLIIAAFGLTFLVVSRFIHPIRQLGFGLARLEQRDYAVQLELSGPPEITTIGDKLNRLAYSLVCARAENRLLIDKLISLQDDERKDIARELHDEFGAHLFAIRASAASLANSVKTLPGGSAQLDAQVLSIIDYTDGLQRLNRRLLSRLRPPALDEIGLKEALAGLVTQWMKQNVNVTPALDLPDTLEGLDAPIALTVYRIVQEGLTNVFRHADATSISVSVAYEPIPGDGEPTAIRVRVGDNGIGMKPGTKEGLGLLGMRERIRGLGGELTITSPVGGGVILDARLPLHRSRQEARQEGFVE